MVCCNRNFVADIQARTITLDQRLASGGVPAINGAGQGSVVDQLQLQQYKTYLEGIKHDVEQIRLNQRAAVNINLILYHYTTIHQICIL